MTHDGAKAILDAARAGLPVSQEAITHALFVTGDLTQSRLAFHARTEYEFTKSIILKRKEKQ